MRAVVAESQNGQRLDVFVVTVLPRLSRAFAQKLCDSGKVAVNGTATRAGRKVKQGDDIGIDYDISEFDSVPVIDLPVMYEDDNCVVVNKPRGVLTHTQGAFKAEASVASFLRTRVHEADGWKDDGRAGIVHRLDRATSGVIIGAKHKSALSFLQKQFAQRKVRKAYIAIVEGHLKRQEAIIDMPIERNPKAPATFRVGANGKPAVTHYKVLKKNPAASLVELKPETGRTHQLRVHMSYIGHPIVNDPLYGHGMHGERLYLHALSLEITLPSHERKLFTAAIPDEFADYMDM